ncbi:MAG: RNA methyltransferase [Bacteroidales bacterium]|nr:RNA methyltransferase [Bacteroidales bacterium]
MVIRISSTDDPRLTMYRSLTAGPQRQRQEEEGGYFIVESPKVISLALTTGHRPLSLLCEEKHILGDAAEVISRCGDIPVYTGPREVLSALTGYPLTRGVLCAMLRPPLLQATELCNRCSRMAVIDGVSDSANIGAIFRAAAALGRDGILLTRTSCDPLLRRSVRVSMGSVFMLPWSWVDDPIGTLRAVGFSLLAMALSPHAIPLDSPELKTLRKTAIVMGAEGDGLAPKAIRAADYVVQIPMMRGVDSLNVAAAAAVAFWELR